MVKDYRIPKLNGMIPDWQLPPGVDRGLWDYLHSQEMVQGYDAQMAASPLSTADIAFCEKHFRPGTLLDLGCGTGRLCHHFAPKGYTCTGVDLSKPMLAEAAATPSNATWRLGNIVDLKEFENASFNNIACLFSTLGMVRSAEHRAAVLANALRVLKPGGCFVLHVHNRHYRGLGWRRYFSTDFTMPQAYGGAPLTIHHFRKTEIAKLLVARGFEVCEVLPIGTDGQPAKKRDSAYGYLIAATDCRSN